MTTNDEIERKANSMIESEREDEWCPYEVNHLEKHGICNLCGKPKRLHRELNMIKQEIASNVPFIKKQYTEQIDKTLLEAKNEIEAFVEKKIRTIGIEGFKKELIKLSDVNIEQKQLENKKVD